MTEPTRLDRLVSLLAEAPDEVFIQPHNVPDPDAIASCAGLRHLLEIRGIKSSVVFDRDIEKVDSLKMLDVVVAYSLRPSGLKRSVRSENPAIKANTLARCILEGTGFGGGHDHMAGGFMPADTMPSGRNLDTYIRYRAISGVEAQTASANVTRRIARLP